MSKTATFDDAPPPGTINFGIGQPSADLLPVELLRQASEAFFAAAQPVELNYGVVAGDARFLDTLAAFLTTGYGVPVAPDSLFVSGGNSQALDMVSAAFASRGDTVFVEEPSYFLAYQIFRDQGLNIVGIPVDEGGVCIKELEEALGKSRPAFLYTIPSFHNPTGLCTSEERRRQVLDLAEKHDFLIVADEVYQLLHYFAPPPPAYGTMTDSERVLSLGSFSKILAPGLRTGWIQTSASLRQRLLSRGFINSGGCINHFATHIIRHAIELNILGEHLVHLQQAYRLRVEAMDAALQEHFAGLAEWTRPDGGYFFWLRFDDRLDTTRLRHKALANQTGFQAGNVFSSKGQLDNFLRLSFAHYNEEDIRTGIARLRPLFA